MIRTFLQALIYPYKILLITIIYVYKYLISPLFPATCRFYPSCSTYMMLAIREWGVRGIWLGIKRICRCRPHGSTGEDFVPINIRGEYKWIF